MSIAETVAAQTRRARAAGRKLASASRTAKDATLNDLAASLRAEAALGDAAAPSAGEPAAGEPPAGSVLAANARDVAAARARGANSAFLDRLALTPARLREMADSADDVRKIQGQQTTEIERLLGRKDFDEVVHRDNLVLSKGAVTA